MWQFSQLQVCISQPASQLWVLCISHWLGLERKPTSLWPVPFCCFLLPPSHCLGTLLNYWSFSSHWEPWGNLEESSHSVRVVEQGEERSWVPDVLHIKEKSTHVLLFFFRIYLFLERGEGREKERQRNINMLLPFTYPLTGTWPATQASALTGNRTGDPCSIHWATPARSHVLF